MADEQIPVERLAEALQRTFGFWFEGSRSSQHSNRFYRSLFARLLTLSPRASTLRDLELRLKRYAAKGEPPGLDEVIVSVTEASRRDPKMTLEDFAWLFLQQLSWEREASD